MLKWDQVAENQQFLVKNQKFLAKNSLKWWNEKNLKGSKKLLKNGPDEYCVREDLRKTPFLWASSEGHEKLLQNLISNGADVNQKYSGEEYDRKSNIAKTIILTTLFIYRSSM